MGKSFRIHVDLDKCVGSRICVAIAPKSLRLNEEGQASPIESSDDSIENIRMAAEACPVCAITLEEID